jgi:hypothetical protein
MVAVIPRAFMLVGVAASISLGACAPQPGYIPPSSGEAQTATIVGSRLVVTSALAEDIRVLLSAVDQKMTSNTRSAWATPVRVPAGSHVIQLIAVQGGLQAEVAMRVTLEPGRAYAARLDRPRASEPAMIWLEDSTTSAPVGDKIPVLTGFSRISD